MFKTTIFLQEITSEYKTDIFVSNETKDASYEETSAHELEKEEILT